MFGRYAKHQRHIEALREKVAKLQDRAESFSQVVSTQADQIHLLTSRMNRMEHESSGIKAKDATEAVNYYQQIAGDNKTDGCKIECIEIRIRDAATNGKTRVDIPGIVPDDIHTELLSRGFSVECYNGYYNRSTIITWRDEKGCSGALPTWHTKDVR